MEPSPNFCQAFSRDKQHIVAKSRCRLFVLGHVTAPQHHTKNASLRMQHQREPRVRGFDRDFTATAARSNESSSLDSEEDGKVGGGGSDDAWPEDKMTFEDRMHLLHNTLGLNALFQWGVTEYEGRYRIVVIAGGWDDRFVGNDSEGITGFFFHTTTAIFLTLLISV